MSGNEAFDSQDVAQFEGWATDAAGERIPLAIVLDTRKRTGVFALGPFGTPHLPLSSLKKLDKGSGLVGRARTAAGLVAWSITAFEADIACEIEVREGEKTSRYTDGSILLFHWFPRLKLPKV